MLVRCQPWCLQKLLIRFQLPFCKLMFWCIHFWYDRHMECWLKIVWLFTSQIKCIGFPAGWHSSCFSNDANFNNILLFTKVRRVFRILAFHSHNNDCSRILHRLQQKLRGASLTVSHVKGEKFVHRHSWVPNKWYYTLKGMLKSTFTNNLRWSFELWCHKSSTKIAAAFCLPFQRSSPCQNEIEFSANTHQASFSSVGWGYCRSPRLMRKWSIGVLCMIL